MAPTKGPRIPQRIPAYLIFGPVVRRSGGLLQLALIVHAMLSAATCTASDKGIVQFVVNDDEGRPIPSRIHLTNERGEPQQAASKPFWHDHFVCSGRASVDVDPGSYRWVIERGPEYQRLMGEETVTSGTKSAVRVTLRRIVNLRDEGWYSGDLHIHRPVEDIRQLMQAEDLDFGPVITWWNAPARDLAEHDETEFQFDGHRIFNNMAGEDEREGGALLYFGLRRPLDLASKSREVPSPIEYVQQARQRQDRVWIDIEKPFWWDVPTWLAVGEMNSIGIANNHMCRSQMLANEAWGKPRNVERLPDPLGNGRWTQEIYYHILNSGIRIPPSAGSASGVLPNPVGYNRVYVYVEDGFAREAWFESLARGRCFVTNGPLLRVSANGELPGAMLAEGGDAAQQVELSIRLTSNDPIAEIEVVQNGRVVDRIACTDETTQEHTATITLREAGWLLVRAVAGVDYTFRFASTGPWYLDPPKSDPRISKQSAQFFVDWIDERIARVKANVEDADDLQEVLKWHLSAREFWLQRRSAANAD